MQITLMSSKGFFPHVINLTLSKTSRSTNLLKTLWEEEKLLITSNYSFTHRVSYPLGKLSAILINFEIIVCKFFQFGSVQILSFGKGFNTGLYGKKLCKLESRQCLLKSIVQGTGYKNSRKAWIGALVTAIQLKYCRKGHLTPYNLSINPLYQITFFLSIKLHFFFQYLFIKINHVNKILKYRKMKTSKSYNIDVNTV